MGCSKELRKQGYKWNRKTKTCEKKTPGASSIFNKKKESSRLKIKM